LQYLAENIGDRENTVFINNGGNRFMYFDDSRISGNYKFTPESKMIRMSFRDFLQKTTELDNDPNSVAKYYLQQSLTVEGVNQKMVEDFKEFNWDWIHQKQAALKMGTIKTTLFGWE